MPACLQSSDKGRTAITTPEIADDPSLRGGQSRRALKRALKELEALRNNLIHAQEIVPDGWDRTVRFSSRLEALIEAGSFGAGPVS